MKKTVQIGTTERGGSIELTIEIEDRNGKGTELSICGDVWLPSRRDIEAGGQMRESLYDYIHKYAPGWDRARLEKVIAIWDRWHLNGMRAGCEHQRANWPDVTEKRTLYTYTLTNAALTLQGSLKRRAQDALANAGSASLTDEEKRVFAAPYSVTTHTDTLPSDLYKLASKEDKAIGWLTEKEHPDGLLSKKCEVCGYKYGHSWMFETLPLEVITELGELTRTN